MDIAQESLQQHALWHGKIECTPKMRLENRHDLAVAYTPGVAEPCKAIAAQPELAYEHTIKRNTVAVVTDGSAVLGLGNIGPLAALPVMEGKAVLFKEFGGVDAFPICLDTQDTDEIVETVIRLAPAFGGINLEDISAPRCFEIEERLNDALDIPVFHDDQHGTAIVVLSGLINALRLVNKRAEEVSVVVNGAGSAGIAISKLLLAYGFTRITLADRKGLVSSRTAKNEAQRAMLAYTNLDDVDGTLADGLRGADVAIGVSGPGAITPAMVASMAPDAIVFALANPTPEIFPDEALAAGARVVATGRSDFPNQVNNVIAFPGIFKGALEARAERITQEMKLAAANALANLVSPEELDENHIMPD
ncbi:MAG: NADP-dependent malic enzyme, partial [Eggerthellaceae bacterium]|nr:NADP-dependent malic enzyme [Eggerthellaceae bacterium]